LIDNRRTFVIRELAPTDSTEALTVMLHRAYAPLLVQGLNYTASAQDSATTARRCALGTCLVAVAYGALDLPHHDPSLPTNTSPIIIGTLTYHDGSRSHNNAPILRPGMTFFEQFGVEPEWQGHGVGRALLQELDRRAASEGAIELGCDTAEPAVDLIAMYRRWGFRIEGRWQWPGKTYFSVGLVKQISGESADDKRLAI